jgi:hypothetical protein
MSFCFKDGIENPCEIKIPRYSPAIGNALPKCTSSLCCCRANWKFRIRKLEKVISTWPESDRRNAEKIVAELGPVVREVREVNRQNRSLVGNELKYMDFMMNLLVSTYRKGSMYGPRGGLSINQGNLFFNSAA